LIKIALVTDSACDLTREEIEQNNVHVLPLRIIYKDREYLDRVNITPDEVYDNLHKEVPTTSLPSIDEMDKLFVKLKEEGYTHIIGICISSGLSGTYNSLKLVSENHKDIESFIFDSLSLSLGTGAVVLGCADMIKQQMDFEAIIGKLPNLRSRIKLYYVLDTLQYLIRGGRIGKVSGTIGELLSIKPIISVNEEGVYYTHSKARGRKKSISKLLEIVQTSLNDCKSKVWVLHGGALEEGKELYGEVAKLNNLTGLEFSNISPAAGVHTGPGLLGIAIMSEE
jgi:DegV family protein with EDD domain